MDKIKKDHDIGAVLVVGGGIGGMQASLDLAESGFYVYLVEHLPTIGGVMAQLDKTFPTNDCAMCIMSPKLVGTGRHLNIRVLSNAEIEKVEGEPGRFGVTVIKKPWYISPERCTGCGECAKHCPVSAIDSYNENLSRRAAVYLRYPQGVPKVYLIDREQCIGCGLCEKVCLARAVNYADTLTREEFQVGSIILAPGYEVFDAQLRPEFGYGSYANVLTSIEFERLLSATGPHRGHILRPSDGTIPERIAFIQCVGSRDVGCGNDYCSSICCMYSTKEAIIAKEHVHFIRPTIFYLDIRAYGKGFDAYYERAKAEYGVRYVKAMVAKVHEQIKTQNLLLTYMKDGEKVEEEFDLVVLAVGVVPSPETREMARRMGVKLDEHGFCETQTFSPTSTSQPGIYVCGAFQSPKDIPETVSQASGAAAAASGILSDLRGTMVTRKEYPDQRDVRQEEPRIGVFVCHCGINIGGVVDVPAVKEYARTLPNVVYAEENLYTCSQDTQEKIHSAVHQHQLNRVIVASCSPRTHEPLFRETLLESGLNKFLFEMANIRDQCSWVHMRQKEEATEKAKDLVRMAVANARTVRPLEEINKGVIKRGLVIGGGLAGMTAALGLAEQGFEAYLVEKEGELGGNLRHLYNTVDGQDVQRFLGELKERVKNNPRIQVFTDAEVTAFSGFVGNFKTTLRIGSNGWKAQELEHGVTILATGGQELKPQEYLYGEDPRVMTQLELGEVLAAGGKKANRLKTVVMIQCVGSREEGRPYCSRVCCAGAVKNALKIKEINPEAQIHILYRDVRTYGLNESYYAKARQAGVLFAEYDPKEKPEVRKEGETLSVSFLDRIMKERVVVNPDLLVLSSAVVPTDTSELARIMKLPRNSDGFFLEAHMKLRPVDFATEGIYLCGMAHSPKLIEESLSQASAAVSRACTVLAKDELQVGGVISVVNPDKCAACLTCVRVCPYEVPVINKDGVAEIEAAKCQGCGTCMAECPARAIELMHFRNDQMEAKCQALVMGT
jgi:heterodisulfide reductase subunit A